MFFKNTFTIDGFKKNLYLNCSATTSALMSSGNAARNEGSTPSGTSSSWESVIGDEPSSIGFKALPIGGSWEGELESSSDVFCDVSVSVSWVLEVSVDAVIVSVERLTLISASAIFCGSTIIVFWSPVKFCNVIDGELYGQIKMLLLKCKFI